MDVRAFRQSPTGQLISGPDGWAFVPHPLPPRLVIDIVLERQLTAANRAVEEMVRLLHSLPDPQLLTHPFIRREAVFSCRLAGRQVDLADLYACQASGIESSGWSFMGNEDDAREALRLAQTVEYALQRLSEMTINLRLVRELHARLHQRQAPSEFRFSQNWIGPPGSGLKEATYVPPPVGEVQPAMRQLESYCTLSSDARFHPLVRLAFAYCQFEAIHPFLDGNGRVGRMLIPLLACQWGFLPQPILTMSAHFDSSRQTCDSLLLAVSRDGDWRSWVLYFLRGVETQARDATRRMKSIQQVHAAYCTRLERPLDAHGSTRAASPRLMATLAKVADRLVETPILTIAGLQKTLEVHHLNAQRAAQYLVDAGILAPLARTDYDNQRDGVVQLPVYVAMELLSAIVL
jgi:Fic family protein